MSEVEDPVLAKQAKNRAVLDKVLGRHGWKLGAVSLRRGAVLVYNLERLSDGKTIEHTMLLSDVLMWSINEPEHPLDEACPSPGEILLGAALLLRVQAENKRG